MKRFLLLLLFCFTAGVVPASRGEGLLFLDEKELAEKARLFQEGRPDAETSRWVAQAEKLLLKEPVPITEKPRVAASNDPHDYYSIGIYWWPNEKTKDGLPYIRRDGIFNPESNQYDRVKLETFARETMMLGRAFAITRDRRFADKALAWVRQWQINPATRMNPNLQHAQAWPGWTVGGPTGLIEGAIFAMNAPDGLVLLRRSGVMSAEAEETVDAWYAELLRWLEESSFGKQAAMFRHNHANYYDLQRVSYALVLGEVEKAKAILSEVGPKRIAAQIRPDGQMPAELKRTKSWDYCCYSLTALVHLARIGDRYGVDVWGYEAPEGGASLRRALDYLVPFAKGEKPWVYENVTGYRPRAIVPLLKMAAPHYPDAGYLEAAEAIEALHAPKKKPAPTPTATPQKEAASRR